MNRRSLLKALGLGSIAAVVAPKVLAEEPEKRSWFSKRMSKKILDARIDEKCVALGLSRFRHTSIKLKAWGKFMSKAKIDVVDAQEILDSINMESVAEMDRAWQKSLQETHDRNMK